MVGQVIRNANDEYLESLYHYCDDIFLKLQSIIALHYQHLIMLYPVYMLYILNETMRTGHDTCFAKVIIHVL